MRECGSETKYFNLVSSGRTATHWIAEVLSHHPDIFCVHGPEASPYVERNETEVERTMRQQQDARHIVSMNPDDYYDLLEIKPFKVYGVIHGINTIGPHLSPEDYRREFFTASITREPTVRLKSFINRWMFEAANIPGRQENLESAASCVHVECVEAGSQLPEFENLSLEDRIFIYACYWIFSNELFEIELPVFRSEDLTSDPIEFRRFFDLVTGDTVEVSENYMIWVFQQRPIDQRTENNLSAEQLYSSWQPWQQHLFTYFLHKHNLIQNYREIGYPIEFIG